MSLAKFGSLTSKPKIWSWRRGTTTTATACHFLGSQTVSKPRAAHLGDESFWAKGLVVRRDRDTVGFCRWNRHLSVLSKVPSAFLFALKKWTKKNALKWRIGKKMHKNAMVITLCGLFSPKHDYDRRLVSNTTNSPWQLLFQGCKATVIAKHETQQSSESGNIHQQQNIQIQVKKKR